MVYFSLERYKLSLEHFEACAMIRRVSSSGRSMHASPDTRLTPWEDHWPNPELVATYVNVTVMLACPFFFSCLLWCPWCMYVCIEAGCVCVLLAHRLLWTSGFRVHMDQRMMSKCSIAASRFLTCTWMHWKCRSCIWDLKPLALLSAMKTLQYVFIFMLYSMCIFSFFF